MKISYFNMTVIISMESQVCHFERFNGMHVTTSLYVDRNNVMIVSCKFLRELGWKAGHISSADATVATLP